MNNLFRAPANALERLIINAEMWEITCEWQPSYYKKHTAAEVHMHRRTTHSPEAESPLFKKYVVDEEE